MTPRTIDVHAHILAQDTMALLQKEAPGIGLRLTPIDADSAVLEIAGTTYRPFPKGGWDLERRLADMQAAEIGMQVLSNSPQTFLYDQDPALTMTAAALQNEQIAALVRAMPERFCGLATLPMQDTDRAVAELRRAVRELGLCGAQIATHVNGKNLDHDTLAPFWAEAAALDAFIMIHPINPAGSERLSSYYLANLVGNPIDTTIAAACLAFGGVMQRHPDLKVLLVHGGGFVPYQYGRWNHGWRVRPEPQKLITCEPEPAIRRFYYDTITHSRPALEYLIATMGAQQIVLGSDYPYDMGNWELVRDVQALSIADADKQRIRFDNAAAVLKR